MLQNKIYQNFTVEILKTFFVVLLGLSLIAYTIRAVNFLDLIVDSGYPVGTYFKYSILNLTGISVKFIPFSFLISLSIFILKHSQDNEFLILWTSGVKKIKVVNLFVVISLIIFVLYLCFSTFFTPFALNKSRQLLSKDELNSFLPTIKSQQFNDSFKGLTIVVDKKFKNELQNIFIHDQGNNLKNLSSNSTETKETIVIAEKGIVEKKNIFLLNGQIISSKKDKITDELIKFEQLSIDLNIENTTIKQPKLQETSTKKLLGCFLFFEKDKSLCKKDAQKEIIPALNRRLIIPFYIPIISLICSVLLVNSKKKYLNYYAFFLNFSLLVFLELTVRFTGMNYVVGIFFTLLPFILFFSIYFWLILRFSKEQRVS